MNVMRDNAGKEAKIPLILADQGGNSCADAYIKQQSDCQNEVAKKASILNDTGGEIEHARNLTISGINVDSCRADHLNQRDDSYPERLQTSAPTVTSTVPQNSASFGDNNTRTKNELNMMTAARNGEKSMETRAVEARSANDSKVDGVSLQRRFQQNRSMKARKALFAIGKDNFLN